jgi:hypothetical protein
MSIKQHYETAYRNIEAEKERAIATAKEKTTREVIIPKNVEFDNYKNNAINALTTELNEKIANLQKDFNEQKTSIIEATEKKKSDFASCTLNAEIAVVSQKYDSAINELKAAMSKMED